MRGAKRAAQKGFDMNIVTASLAEIGRFVAGRTANMEAAKIAHSSAPQVRYDAVIPQVIRDPQQRGQFSKSELLDLASRISDDCRRASATNMIEGNYY